MSILRKLIAALAIAALALAGPATAGEKPLVIQGAKIKQLPAATALQLQAPTTSSATVNLPHGTAPASPTNGDCWTTTGGLYCRINGVTVGPYSTGGGGGGSGAAEVVASSSTIGSGLITITGLSLSNYSRIEIVAENLTAASSLRPYLQVSVGGSFLAGTNYNYNQDSAATSGSTEGENSSGNDAIYLMDNTSANWQVATGHAGQAEILIFDPGGTTFVKQGRFEAFNGQGASGVFVRVRGGFKLNTSTGAIDGIRIGGAGSVALTSGTVTIYGYKRV